MRNAEIAAAFGELAALYELDGANRYRVLAYREAARAIGDCPQSVAELAREGRATELQGIGETLQAKIIALLEQGEIPSAAKLKRKYPASLVDVMAIPGVGARTARKLHDELGIESRDDLRSAAEQERLRTVKGLGAKLERNVLAALERLEVEGDQQRFLLPEVLEIGTGLVADLSAHAAGREVMLAGSARRWTETCKDVDLVATSAEPGALAQALCEHELAAERGSSGSSGARIRTHSGVPVELRIVPAAEFGSLLQHFTGSKEHNVKLRERAVGMGLSVSEHGIGEVATGEVATFDSEAAVYERLGLEWIEPELRQGRDEIAAAAAGELPRLIELDDVRGDLHCHTTLSDGHNTLTEMAAAARRRGYGYLAVTDHSATHGFGDDVQPDALRRRIEEVRELDSELGRFHLLAGSEVNVAPDGSLDYGDALLAELDWVIASVHTSFRLGRARMTERLLRAIEHPLVDCIGHPTGRLLLRREPYELDVERIFAAAAENGTMIEVNGNPRRRDLNESHARLAAEAGVRIVLNTDAHRTETLGNMPYAVATARRAGLEASQIANTRSWRSFAPLRKRHRA